MDAYLIDFPCYHIKLGIHFLQLIKKPAINCIVFRLSIENIGTKGFTYQKDAALDLPSHTIGWFSRRPRLPRQNGFSFYA